MVIERVISGGQTGADQAGLVAAKELGLKTGGYMPRGFRTDNGSRRDFIELYGMLEHSSREYSPRTELNIVHSSGTLIFGIETSPGCSLTKRLCLSHTRDLFIVPWTTDHPVPSIAPFVDWARHRGIKILNVAGNRERTNPGIFEACKTFLISALNELQGEIK